MHFTIVHAADLHLDTPFSGVGVQSPWLQAALVEASLDSFDRLIDLTLREGAAALLLAGDLYDGPDRGLRAQLRFRDGLKRLGEAGVQVFIVHGNHDPVDEGWSAMGHWPEHVHVFGAGEVQAIPLLRDGQHLATVHGISYGTRQVTQNLAQKFHRSSDEVFQVGLLHANVGNHAGHHAYAPCTDADLAAACLDYWALGHIHTRRSWRVGQGWAAYPGNLQGRSPKPGELGAKGALVLEVDRGRISEPRFVALDGIRFLNLEIQVDGLDDLGQLADRLAELADQTQASHEGRSLILRAILTGRAALHDVLRTHGRLDDLLGRLRTAGERAPFVWWDELLDRTLPTWDRTLLAGRDDFLAGLLRISDSARTQGPDREYLTRQLASIGPGEDWEALLHEAETLAIDLLHGSAS